MKKSHSFSGFALLFILLEFFTLQAGNKMTKPDVSSEVLKLIKKTLTGDAYKDAGAIILLKEGKLSIGEKGSYHFTIHVLGKILDSKAKSDYSQISIQFNSYYDDIKLDFARTIRENGEVLDISEDAIQIKTESNASMIKRYTDNRFLTFSLPALNEGMAFEYQVTLTEKRAIIENEWFSWFNFYYIPSGLSAMYLQQVAPVYQSRLLLQLAEGEEFLFHFENIKPIKPVVKKENGKLVYTWEAKDLPGIPLEEGMPSLYDNIANIQLTSLKEWKEIDKWASEHFLSRIEISPEIQSKAEELTRESATAEDKIAAIYYFIQQEIDYVQADLGRSGYTPHYANEILRSLYGDCKDQVTLFISLLKAVGIEAYPALISTFQQVIKEVPSPLQFDHLIVYIPQVKKAIWLDTTSGVTLFPNLPGIDQDCWAFVVNGQGGRFCQTPPSEPENNVGISDLSFYIENDIVKSQVVLEGTGEINDNLKSTFKTLNNEQQQEFLKKFMLVWYEKAKIDTIITVGLNDPRSSFKTTIRFELGEVLNKWLSSLYYDSNALVPFSFFSDFQNLPSPDNRRNDLEFACRFKVTGSEKYPAPAAEFKPDKLPEDYSLNTPLISFFRKAFKEEDMIIAKWELIVKQQIIKQAEYKTFYEDIQKVMEKLTWKVEFSRAAEYLADEEAKDEMRISLIVVKTKKQAQEILNKLKKGEDFGALAKENSIGPGKEQGGDIGFLSAGVMMKELDAAALTLQVGQISGILETPNGYYILKKTDEKSASEQKKEKSFERLLEQGKTAYKNGAYADAIRFLSEAAEISPDNQEVHYFLGYAYERAASPTGNLITEAKLSFTEKASEHFQKVIDIAPEYKGELVISDPYSRLSSIWGALALAFAYQGKLDSALWAFEQGQLRGGFLPGLLEYNKNTMASCEKNGILLTNGDNDTFPMWFLQCVEGYRKDINIVNLSLLNTAWYIKMLKNDDLLGKNTIPLDLTEKEIDELGIKFWQEQEYSIPVSGDPMNISGKIHWKLTPKIYEKYIRVQDQVLIKMIESNRWQRPVYFSTTVSKDNQIGLGDYLAMEGLVFRLISHKVMGVASHNLSENLFKRYTFNAVDDEHTKYSPDLVGIYENYRGVFFLLAQYFFQIDEPDSIILTIDAMNTTFPPERFPYANKKFEFYTLNMMGRAYLDKDQYGKAIEIFKEASNKMPDDPDNFYRLGEAYRYKECYEEAISAYDNAIKIDPDHKWAYISKGRALRELKCYEEAVSTINKAIAIDPEYDYAYNQLGYTYLKMDLYDKSIAAYMKAIELDSIDSNSYGNLGWVHYLKGDFGKSIEYSEKAVTLDSTAIYARYNIALAYLRSGKIDEAKKRYLETKKYDLALNHEIHSGAISDLKGLIKQNIMSEHAQMILVEVFGIRDE